MIRTTFSSHRPVGFAANASRQSDIEQELHGAKSVLNGLLQESGFTVDDIRYFNLPQSNVLTILTPDSWRLTQDGAFKTALLNALKKLPNPSARLQFLLADPANRILFERNVTLKPH